jgi:transposase InsO family protein
MRQASGFNRTGAIRILVHLLPKTALIDRHRFRSHSEARMAIFQFIEGFYNPSRRHSALGYLSPIEYERKHHGLTKPA